MTIHPIYEPKTTLRNTLNAAKDKKCFREQMARFYADCLLANVKEWAELNAAIQERWPKGLRYIKEKAWRIACKETGIR